jgi:hypothetical protein
VGWDRGLQSPAKLTGKFSAQEFQEAYPTTNWSRDWGMPPTFLRALHAGRLCLLNQFIEFLRRASLLFNLALTYR